MAATPKLWQAALPVLDCREKLRVPCFLAGGLAGKLWGLVRTMPQDVPVTAVLALSHAAPLVEALEGSYYADAGRIAQGIRRHAAFQLIHLQTLLHVEVTAAEDTAFTRSVLARRIGRELPEAGARTLFFASPEDVLLRTLLALPHDGIPHPAWDEIQATLVEKAGTLDLAYLRTWARRLDLLSALDRALMLWEQSRPV